jgi:hypothetical protein
MELIVILMAAVRNLKPASLGFLAHPNTLK